MNYNLKQRSTPITNIVRTNGTVGKMPDGHLMAKFEETEIESEGAYDNYARGNLVDQRPDTVKFEHEESRGGVSARSGFIQHRYYGHRGSADPERPEMFLGFGGPEDADPRGTSTDPDMKQLVRQEYARMKYIPFSADSSHQITSGGRSESQIVADKQKLFKVTRERLQVFDQQLDGRREGITRSFKHKSAADGQEMSVAYSDIITDYAMAPQRRANLVSKEVIRGSRRHLDEQNEQELGIAKYSIRTKAGKQNTHKLVMGAKAADDTKWTDADSSKAFKAAGVLMRDLVQARRELVGAANGDTQLQEHQLTQVLKSVAPSRDLNMILRAIATDGQFTDGDTTMARKGAKPVQRAHLKTLAEHNHVTPAHQLLNAEIIYKSVKSGKDLTKIKHEIVADGARAQTEDGPAARKSSKLQILSGMRDVDGEAEHGESDNTVNYKTLIADLRGSKLDNVEQFDGAESDNTMAIKRNHTNYRNPDQRDISQDGRFNDNAQHERHGGRLGSKYTTRSIDRDSHATPINGI